MSAREFDKLVRDRIPDIIRENGGTPVCRTLSEEEYVSRLEEKLGEELAEYLESRDAEELADLLEVILALAASQGVSPQDLERIRREKAEKRGGFFERTLLIRVTD